MSSDEPVVRWVQPDPTVDAFFRMTFLGVALLWGGAFVFAFQEFGDCPGTHEEVSACQATSMELGRRAAVALVLTLATTVLAIVAVARPRGRLPTVLAITGVAGVIVSIWSVVQAVAISAGIDLALLLPPLGAAFVASAPFDTSGRRALVPDRPEPG